MSIYGGIIDVFTIVSVQFNEFNKFKGLGNHPGVELFHHPKTSLQPVCSSPLLLSTTLDNHLSAVYLYKLAFSRGFVCKIEILLLFPYWKF